MFKNLTILFFSLFSVMSFGQTNKTIKVTEKEIKPVEIKTISDTEVISDAVPVHDAQPIDENYIYNVAGIEVKPEFPGGIEKFHLYVSKKFNYSKEMKEAQLKGKVFASFVVEKNGNITDIKILRDRGYDSGKELLRILKGMPNWKPAVQNGKIVRCNYLVPINLDATKE